MAFLAGMNAAVYITSNLASVSLPANDVLSDSGDHKTFVEATASHRYWDDSAVPTVQAQVDDIQTVSITGAPTGGTFTLVFGGQTTATINWNDPASTVQTRLQALSSILSGNALVTGGPGPGTPYVVEFTSALGYAAQGNITLGTNSLTGGSSPSVSIVHTQNGFAWTTQSATLYTVQYVGGKILFTSVLLGTPQCRLSTGGKYFAYTTFAQGTSWELDGSADMAEDTVFGGGRGKTFKPTLFTGKFMLKSFYIDSTFFANITTGARLIFSGSVDGTKRYESYCYTSSDKIIVPVGNLVTEDVEFQVSGAWYAN